MTPPPLAWGLLSLPLILHNHNRGPLPSYSKAPRGLFVLSRVARIFTGLAISPSPSLRQRPGRDAIRAGRNLPDKGFRYLRHFCYFTAIAERAGHFCRPLHVAMQVGPSLLTGSVGESGVWSLRIPERFSARRGVEKPPYLLKFFWGFSNLWLSRPQARTLTRRGAISSDRNCPISITTSQAFPADCPHRSHCYPDMSG